MDYRYLQTRGWLNEAALAAGEPARDVPSSPPPPPPPPLASRRTRQALTGGRPAGAMPADVSDVDMDFQTLSGTAWAPEHATHTGRADPAWAQGVARRAGRKR